MKNISKSVKILLVIFIFLAMSYLPILLSHKQISPDAYFIIPTFKGYDTIWVYLKALFNFETVDFQPVRDASLFLDWWIYENWKINIFIFHNILIWTLSCFMIFKIMKRTFNQTIEEKHILLIVLAFAAYPLFSSSVCWSIARKHLLATMFLLWGTDILQSLLERYDLKKMVLVCSLYFLSVFSQPIGMLWFLWVILYVKVNKKEKWKTYWPLLFSLFLIFVSVLITTYLYYEKSAFFTFTFNSKTSMMFQIWPKILVFGHYMHKLFFPYLPVLHEVVTYSSIVIGWIITLTICVLYRVFKLDYMHFFTWVAFTLFPLVIVLNTPNLTFDTYLLLPSFGMLMLILPLMKRWKLRPLVLWGMILFFGAYTSKESMAWLSSDNFNERNFQRAPSCSSARVAALDFLTTSQPAPKEKIDFLISNGCLDEYSTTYNALEIIIFKSLLVYQDPLLNEDKKVSILLDLSDKNFFPGLVLANLYIDQKRYPESQAEIGKALIPLRGAKLIEMFENDVVKNVFAYCERISYQDCIEILSKLDQTTDWPYL